MIVFVFRASIGAVLFVLAVLFFLALDIAHMARGDTILPPESQRTASWYAAHPDIMRRTLRVCRDDPGHLAFSPSCTNARQGEMNEAASIAAQMALRSRREAGLLPRHDVRNYDQTLVELWLRDKAGLISQRDLCNSARDPRLRIAYSCNDVLEAARRAGL